ncbi:TPA: response regulator [Candidatus Poribacteria bacterium]|nr:response regulator [Candidatus Poribacteria bacterium]
MNNPPRILLDKNLGDDQSLSLMLKENGYEVLLNNHNEDIGKAISEINPDLILLDATKLESYSEIKKNQDGMNSPIIFVTPKEKSDIIDKIDLDDINQDFVTKPFKLNEMLLRIQTHLKIKAMIEQKMALQNELQTSQKTASIATLAGAIAHDINNLIGAIMGYSDLLKITANERKSMDYADKIMEASQKVSELTNNLLAYSRSIRSDPTEVDVRELLEKVLILHGEPNFKTLNYDLKICDDIPKVYVDKGQIFRAISGIFLNVKEATSENGTIHILANVGELPQNTRVNRLNSQITEYVIITITNSERYMDETTAQEINDMFDMNFFDYNSELSLSAAINIIKRNKGFFWIDAKSLGETKFIIYLPKVTPKTT